ncbi:MAG: PIG-L family deacetylase [Alphaproteobacteria bacterium]
MIGPFGKKILILIPHPDDEVVACAAAIRRAQAEGAKIYGAYLTHGCPALQTLWPWQRRAYKKRILRRHEEARRAATMLGIMPVSWKPVPARFLWRQLPKALKEIEEIILKYQIDQLWVPAYEGGNADHDGLNAVGRELGKQMPVIEFAEYNWCGGAVNSHQFPFPTRSVSTIYLTPEEQEWKRRCLAVYASEKRNLSYVDVTRESFRPLANYDYSRPPHPGLLWYMRFRWVPFHHPGIDRTTPAMVSRAIGRFQTS